MSTIPVNSINIGMGSGSAGKAAGIGKEEGQSFDAVINEALSRVSQVQENAEQAVNELAGGGDISNAVLAIEKADMSFQLMVEIRNKLISAYEEVMRIQV